MDIIGDKKMDKNEALVILGLEKGSTEDEIKRAYKRLAFLHHPDRHSGKATSIKTEQEELFKKVGEAYGVLTQVSTDKSLDDPLDEWFSDFFKIPTRDEYLEAFSRLFEEAGLELNNLQVFNAMTENEVEIVGHNLGDLFENDCLNQQSFDIACEHLSWPNKGEYEISNPYVLKFIFESLAAKANLNIPSESECNLSHYHGLVEAFKILSEDVLVTQERLNQLMKHSSVADDVAYTITRLDRVNLLTPENEAFTLAYLSKMGDCMFSTLTYQLLSKDEKETLTVLQKARMRIEWAINREQNVKHRQDVNLQKIVATKRDFQDTSARNKAQTIDLTAFKEKYRDWYNAATIIKIVELYATGGFFSAEQINSSDGATFYFLTTLASKNLIPALVEGLVTIDDINSLFRWSYAHGTSNCDYLERFLDDDCIELTRKGLFSLKDVYAFESPHELRGYIKEQAKNLTVNIGTQNPQSSSKESQAEPKEWHQSAIKIQSLVRGYLARKNIKDLGLSEKVSEPSSASLAEVAQSDRIEPSILLGKGSTLDPRGDDITPQNNSSNTISKQAFTTILSAYKSQSFLGYLSSFWIFSWISPTRSQTMRELQGLLSSTQDKNSVSRDQIEEAINKGDNKTHRLGLLKEELGRIKTTGTDEVVVQLKEALKKTP